MNASFPEPVFPNHSSGFDSRDCVDVAIDVIGDKTIRPLRPRLLQLALAERERYARLKQQNNEASAK